MCGLRFWQSSVRWEQGTGAEEWLTDVVLEGRRHRELQDSCWGGPWGLSETLQVQMGMQSGYHQEFLGSRTLEEGSLDTER